MTDLTLAGRPNATERAILACVQAIIDKTKVKPSPQQPTVASDAELVGQLHGFVKYLLHAHGDDYAYRIDGGTVTLLGQVTRPSLQSDAANVVINLSWTAPLKFSSVTASQGGNCSAPSGNSVACAFSSIANGGSSTVDIGLLALLGVSGSVSANAVSDAVDSNPAKPRVCGSSRKGVLGTSITHVAVTAGLTSALVAAADGTINERSRATLEMRSWSIRPSHWA